MKELVITRKRIRHQRWSLDWNEQEIFTNGKYWLAGKSLSQRNLYQGEVLTSRGNLYKWEDFIGGKLGSFYRRKELTCHEVLINRKSLSAWSLSDPTQFDFYFYCIVNYNKQVRSSLMGFCEWTPHIARKAFRASPALTTNSVLLMNFSC